MAHRLTTCTFCGVGCGLYLETSGNVVVGAYPSVSHPTNQGRICVRGWHVHEIASSPERLTSPLIRKNGKLQEASWEEVLAFLADRLTEIRLRYGADSLAFINSPRCSNEEAYLLQKFARCVVGTNNVDHGAGVFCNNSIPALLEMLGVPASTNSIGELAQSDVIVVDGVDLARRMPTIGGAVVRAKLKGAQLIVIGTRRHRISENASLFLQIRPGTDVLLYGAMAKVIDDRGLMNLPFIRTRCREYQAFRTQIREYDLLEAAEACGVPAEQIEAAAIAYARAKAAALLYSTGAEARHNDSIQAIVNLVLLTGNLGRPGAGLFALTEQNNLQGVCDLGMLPDHLPAYSKLDDVSARGVFEQAWQTTLPAMPGLSTRRVMASDRIKALWLSRYDPVSAGLVCDASDLLHRFELVVAQHPFLPDAAPAVDVLLPTTAFSEERVSFTSTDRRIQLAEKVIEPVAGPMPVWQQITLLARLMGTEWPYRSSAEVMREIGEVVPFYSGADYDNLARDYGRQWPCTKDRPLGTPTLFADSTDGRRFKFVPVPKPAPTPVSKEFPLTLLGGYSLYYWNQDVLIRHSETLNREYRILSLDYPKGFVEMNPEDAKALGIRDGEKVRLHTPRASVVSTARLTPEARSGTVYVPAFVRNVEEQIVGGAADSARLVPVRVEREAG